MDSAPRPTAKTASTCWSTSMPFKSSSNTSHQGNCRTQRELQALMEEELYHATFECNCKDFVEQLCPAGDSLVTSVMKCLKTRGITHERSHYVPFASFLNNVLSCIPNRAGTIHANLRFYKYDRRMKEGIGLSSPLKPDIIGCHCPWDGASPLSWTQVDVAVEVKDTWPSMLTQAASYARSQFVSQPYRQFVAVIYFQHLKKDVRVGFHFRSGLVVTELMTLTEKAGFRNFVTVILGIGSWTEHGKAGIDTSLTGNLVSIPGMGVWEIEETLCDRKVIRGRSTRVFRLVEHENSRTATTPTSPPRTHAYNLRSRRKPYSVSADQGGKRARREPASALNDASRTPEIMAIEGLNLNKGDSSSSNLPQGRAFPKDSSKRDSPKPDDAPQSGDHDAKEATLFDWDVVTSSISIDYFKGDVPPPKADNLLLTPRILKDSWPLVIRSEEGSIFQPLCEKFGLPVVITSYPVAKDGGVVIPDTATPLDREHDSFVPETRVHMRIVFATEGRVLTEAPGPRSLVEGILHAMLGHYVLFSKGWLHRDVSIGNVMLMKEENREPVKDFDITVGITKCVGFICDGDQAIYWKDRDREVGNRRSGTLPFMSQALIDAWVMNEPFSHTAVDDLESFVWVLLWSVLNILRSREALDNNQERYYLQTMRSDDIEKLVSRSTFLRKIMRCDHKRTCSRGFEPFSKLLIQWLGIAQDANDKDVDELEDSDRLFELCHGVYKDYINSGLDYLKNLPENWDYISAG